MRTFSVAAAFSVIGALTLTAADWKAPRTAWGEPDLQGVWSSAAELSVPFERPDGRVPPTTAEARQRATVAPAGLGNGPFDGPEQMSMWVRCIGRGVPI